jgi:large subunit ribosomal protein L9
MEIILLKDIHKVGDKNEIVTVKNGYGRNFLLPQGMAIVANDSNRRKLAEILKVEDKREAKKLGAYQEVATKLQGILIQIPAKAGASGRLFGSINAVQLANAIKQATGVEIDRKKIVLAEDIKDLGTYSIPVNLHAAVIGTANIEVVAQ